MVSLDGGVLGHRDFSNRHDFHVAYHGAHVHDHSMDVEALAPALMAFGRLIREANTVLNGDRAQVKVLVTSDFEHKCFNINFEVIQNIVDNIKSFLDGIRDAKQILQSVGLIAPPAGVALYGYLKWKKGRRIERTQTIEGPMTGAVIIKVAGNNNTIQIPQDVFKLAENKNVVDAVMETIKPIETNVAKSVEFREEDKPVSSYNSVEVNEIISSCESDRKVYHTVEVRELVEPKVITASLRVYAPVFDNKAKLWRFRYNRKTIYADISETSIARETMKRGGSSVNDHYRVRMEVIPPVSPRSSEPQYRIKEVLDFTPAPQQAALPLPKLKNPPKTPRLGNRRASTHGRGTEEKAKGGR